MTKCQTDDSTRNRALDRILAELQAGLQHGYFEYTLTCEVIGGGRRRMILHAGKTYQFVLAAESCTATERAGDEDHRAPAIGARELMILGNR